MDALSLIENKYYILKYAVTDMEADPSYRVNIKPMIKDLINRFESLEKEFYFIKYHKIMKGIESNCHPEELSKIKQLFDTFIRSFQTDLTIDKMSFYVDEILRYDRLEFQ